MPTALESLLQKQQDQKPGQENEKELSGREILKMLQPGGVYIPPFKMRKLQSKLAKDESSTVYQRLQWEALKKSINGLINKANKSNIKNICVELFNENLIRGRGLFCRSLMKAQMASPQFTPVYTALVAIVNTKMPELGELLCKRVIMQFQRCYRRKDKIVMRAVIVFVAHLVNQQVLHELPALQMLSLLLEKNPTDDSIEVAKEFVLHVGAALREISPEGLRGVMEIFRSLLHEENSKIDKRVQYSLESLFKEWRTKFENFPAIPEELNLLDEGDIITHNLDLTTNHQLEKTLDIFHYDPDFGAHEKDFEAIKKEILGDSSDDDDDEDGGSSSSSSEEENEKMEIQDMTGTNERNLRRKIYLIIKSSLQSEEMVHKVLKMVPDEEKTVSEMVVECCSHERTYDKRFGLMAERLCKLRQEYEDCFDELFPRWYEKVHHLETNKIYNIAIFFAHLLASDALDWSVLEFVTLSAEETNPSKRIFLKHIFHELSSWLTTDLRKRFEDPAYGTAFDKIFPLDMSNPKNTRFSINFFTSIGLGGLTERMRKALKEYQKIIAQKRQEAEFESDSDSSSSSSSSSSPSDSSSSSSSSEYEKLRRMKKKKKKKKKVRKSKDKKASKKVKMYKEKIEAEDTSHAKPFIHPSRAKLQKDVDRRAVKSSSRRRPKKEYDRKRRREPEVQRQRKRK